MHGIIFKEFRAYTEKNLGDNSWNIILKETGIGIKHFLPIQEYPDHEMENLVAAVAKKMNINVSELLEEFGSYIVPALMNMYKTLIRPEWKSIDLIEHTEETIHSVVRLKNPGAKPPALVCTRDGENCITIIYSSARKMCCVAIGIINGLASHFGEEIEITEDKCMLHGSDFCTIKVCVIG